MNLLSSILPGLRDLRAPITAGYMWLVAAWVAFAHKVPDVTQATGIVSDVYRMGKLVGSAASIGACSVAAYLIGLVSIWLGSTLGGLLRRRGDRLVPLVTMILQERLRADRQLRKIVVDGCSVHLLIDLVGSGPYPPAPKGERRYYDGVLKTRGEADVREELEAPLEGTLKYGRKSKISRKAIHATIDVWEHARDLENEVRLAPEKLAIGQPAVLERWDRLRSEAEFRGSIVAPLFALAVVVERRGVPLVVVLLLALLGSAMARLSTLRSREATSQLVTSLEAGSVPSATISRLTDGDVYLMNHLLPSTRTSTDLSSDAEPPSKRPQV